MGRRHRGKDSKKASTDCSVSDRLKDARHEFQTISQTFPIARQLLLDEIKRLESESVDDTKSSSSVKTATQRTIVDATQPAQILQPNDDIKGPVKGDSKKVEIHSPNRKDDRKDDKANIKDQINNPSSQIPENVPDHWDQLSPRDDVSACDELKGVPLIGLQDVPEFSPRSLENEKCSTKIFIPHHEYPGYNFIGRLLGPRGVTMKHLQKVSGCRMYIRGRGSLRLRDPAQEQHLAGMPGYEHLNEDLHVLVEYDGPEADRAACMIRAEGMVAQLLRPPPSDELDDLKKEQLRELAILNGTYKENKTLQPCANKRVPGPSSANADPTPSVPQPPAFQAPPATCAYLPHQAPLLGSSSLAGPALQGGPEAQLQLQQNAAHLQQHLVLQQQGMLRMMAMLDAARAAGHDPRHHPLQPSVGHSARVAAPMAGYGSMAAGMGPGLLSFQLADQAGLYRAPSAGDGGAGSWFDPAAAPAASAASAAARSIASEKAPSGGDGKLRPTSAPFQPTSLRPGSAATGGGDAENSDPNRCGVEDGDYPGGGGFYLPLSPPPSNERRGRGQAASWPPQSPCMLTSLPRTPQQAPPPARTESSDSGCAAATLFGAAGGPSGLKISPAGGGARPRWHPYVRSPPTGKQGGGAALEVRLGTSLARSDSGSYRLF